MKTTITIIAIVLIIFSFASCKKEGTGGKASITGYAKHHAKAIPDAVIYIKYGAIESAGTSPGNYDANTTADGAGKYEFKDLNKGDYYLFGIGYDSAISNTVSGGIPIKVKKKTETVNADVSITE